MNAEIQIFDDANFGKLRGMNIDGEAWLMATDVARRLGYTNPQKAIRDHVDEDDKRTERIVHPSGGAQQTLMINESGLYSLVLSSKLSQARDFKHWVTSEVLPQIRQTGGYIPIQQEDDEKTILAKAMLICQKTIEAKDALLEAQRPMVQFAEAISSSDDSILIRDLAKLLAQNGIPVGQTRLFSWLRKHGYLFQRETRPIQIWVERGIFDTNVSLVQTHHGKRERITTKVTGKGQQYFVSGFLSGKFVM